MREITADLAVIGAGSGGLSVAAGAAQLGADVVLFERGRMGGDCLNFGCVPSKALIASALAAHRARPYARLGVDAHAQVGFGAVMAHVRGAIAAVAPHDSQTRFEQRLGVQVVREAARFVGPRTLQAGDLRVRARKIVIATGSRPRRPDIRGLSATPHLTNETIFELHERPAHLLVIGAGAIGLELGQAFCRLGSEVTIVETGRPLAHEDPELVEPVLRQLARDGVRLIADAEIRSVERTATGSRLHIAHTGGAAEVDGSHLLVAVGRAPNLEDLGLEQARVAYDHRGVITDAGLRSISNRAVFAVGDVAGREAFTHAAGAHAALVVRRVLFGLPGRADNLVIPRVTYTDPEVATVGLTELQARDRHGDAVRTVTVQFADNDRAVTEADTRGFAKLVATRRGRLLGVSIVGVQAGDLIQPWGLALSVGLPLRKMAAVVAPYPTRGEVNKRLAGEWFSPLLFSERTRGLVRLLKRFP